jgi:Protein of unknown function (DUF664)
MRSIDEGAPQTWQRFTAERNAVTPEEIQWRPLPHKNTINELLRLRRIEAQWQLASLEHGAQSPYHDLASVQQLAGSVPLEFERNLQELEALYTRFITAFRRTILEALQQQTVLGQIFPGGTPHPVHPLSFSQALHLAQHWGQIHTLRNWYRKTCGEPGRFSPEHLALPT